MHPWLHFKTITKHKLMVMHYCFRIGLYKQGLLHDLSKYTPSEFLVGCKYYQGTMSPNNAEREDKGYSAAWLHHKGRNKHHMEYWIDYGVGDGRDGQKTHRGICGMKMPIKYVAEMYVDRVSASKNYQRDKFKLDSPLQYYLKGRKYYILNEDTKAMLELLLVMLAVKGEDEVNHFLKYEVLKGKVPYEKEYLINLRKNLEKGSAYHLEEEQ
mgnify:CR=1 FL=1